MGNKLLGYDENDVKKAFSSQELTPTIPKKIEPEKTTLETLSESSEKLLEENKEFLGDIYK